MTRPVGTIRSIWRYPIKSMLGEALEFCALTERGLIGDRAFAVVDEEDGKVASAKNPRKWAKLFGCRAEYVESPPAVRIALPDGAEINADDPEIEATLSRFLERKTVLQKTAVSPPVIEELWLDGSPDGRAVTDETIALGSPVGTFFDYAVVHLVTSATLDHLSHLYPQGRFDERRFRPNFLVSIADGESGFVENGWVGKNLAIGDSVHLAVTDPCPRCVMTTLAQDDLPADPGILRTAARHNSLIGGEARGPEGAYPASVGVYARVVSGGTVRRGDEVRVLAERPTNQ
jgi:uncharacterized protein YcbX